MKKIIMMIVAALLAQGASATLVLDSQFNTAGDVEGWVAPVNVTSLHQATAVGSGDEGVLTSVNLTGAGPIVHYGTVALPVGQTWDKIEIRIRMLTTDPSAGVPMAYNNTGSKLAFTDVNNWEARVTTWATESQTGSGVYTGDTFDMTFADESDNHWMLLTVDFANAPYLRSHDMAAIDITSTTDSTRNFEIDSVRLSTVPEPATISVLGLGALVVMLVRRLKS